MSLKLKFVEQACAPGANIAALCREYAISRQTGQKWLRRYHEEGPLGLVEQSRRPRSSPLTKAEDIVAAIVELRNRRPSWGPDKIARVIAARFGSEAPSRSTVARVLRRLGKVKRRRPVARFWAVNGREHVDVRAPNELRSSSRWIAGSSTSTTSARTLPSAARRRRRCIARWSGGRSRWSYPLIRPTGAHDGWVAVASFPSTATTSTSAWHWRASSSVFDTRAGFAGGSISSTSTSEPSRSLH